MHLQDILVSNAWSHIYCFEKLRMYYFGTGWLLLLRLGYLELHLASCSSLTKSTFLINRPDIFFKLKYFVYFTYQIAAFLLFLTYSFTKKYM